MAPSDLRGTFVDRAGRPRARRSVLLACAAAMATLASLASGAAEAAGPEAPPEPDGTRLVMFVGNNWDGTADVVDARTHERLARIDTIPDREERMAEITSSPDRLAYFLAIRELVGEGNDQFTDDMFTTHDGRTVMVSRPSFADVVSIDLATNDIVWRFPMEGYRADHMAISPDGSTLLVSDSTANVVHALDTATGEKVGEFPSGDSPHENVYIADGAQVLHASIGRVYTPTDDPALGPVRDTSKGERVFQLVDADTYEVLQRWDVAAELEEAWYPDMSAAVRPMAVAPDERTVYFQVSFHHGFVEFDLTTGDVTRVAELPISEEAQSLRREQYLLDSAHHGLAMNAAGDTLCAAGTMSDYAAMVDRETFEVRGTVQGTKPYWSTNGLDDTCWVSWSGDDEVSVLSYPDGEELARLPVGDHPQRIRLGVVDTDVLADGGAAYPPVPDASADPAAPPAPAGGAAPVTPVTGGSAAMVGLGVLLGVGLLRRRVRRPA